LPVIMPLPGTADTTSAKCAMHNWDRGIPATR
jgi:hypothetical protein